MGKIAMRPNGSVLNPGWAVQGGGTAHAALADDNPATWLYQSGATGIAALTFPAPAIPAGAKVRALYLRFSSSTTGGKSGSVRVVFGVNLLGAGAASSEATQVVTWSSPTSTNIATVPTDSLAAAELWIWPLNKTRIYEATVWAFYVAAPVTTTPTVATPLNQEARPRLEWDTTFDPDGGSMTDYQVRLYSGTAARNPEVDEPLIRDDGDETITSWTAPSLPNGTYRFYYRPAQTVGGVKHWGAWVDKTFTLNVPRPGTPSLSVSGEDSLAYISLQVTATSGAAQTDWYELESSPDGLTRWEPVFLEGSRDGIGTDPAPGSGTPVVFADYEPANRETRHYRARAISDRGGGYRSTSEWSTVESSFWKSQYFWLKSVRYPGRNVPVIVASATGYTRESRDGLFQGLGSSETIVVSDLPGAPRGDLTVAVDDDVDRDKLREIIEAADPVLLQSTPNTHWEDRWARLTGQTSAPPADKLGITTTLETFGWVEVPRPE